MSAISAENKKNILLVAITRMGDMLQASPTIAGLKRQNPDAHIVVVIDRSFSSICKGIPGIDEVYEIDLACIVNGLAREAEGIVEAYQYISRVVDELRNRQFDYCLNMSSSPYTALLLSMLDIEDSRGWISDEEGYRLISNPWAMLFAAFIHHSNRDYNSLNLVDIFRCAAGVKQHPNHLVYEPTAPDRQFARSFLIEKGLAEGGPLICVQSGASQGKRQWAPERFAAVIRQLVEQSDARVVLTGSDSELNLINAILAAYSHPRVASAAGATSFSELGALLEAADVLVTGDTGPMHLAIAVGTPVVAMFLASALGFETGPYAPGCFVMQPQIVCNPCNPNFPCARPDCHAQITPELVAYLTRLRLTTPRGEEQAIRLPAELVNQRSVAIYLSEFDEDGFVNLRLLGGAAAKNGKPPEYFQSARAAYRALWKEEFDGIAFRGLPRSESMPDHGDTDTSVLAHVVRLTADGVVAIRRLVELVADPKSPPHLLRESDEALRRIDDTIQEAGFATPMIGALIRVFLMEKENMRGTDVLGLASQTERLYGRLAARSVRFANLLRHFRNLEPAEQRAQI